jgi:hypothetical protein
MLTGRQVTAACRRRPAPAPHVRLQAAAKRATPLGHLPPLLSSAAVSGLFLPIVLLFLLPLTLLAFASVLPADQMLDLDLGEQELEGFVAFGADPDDVAAAQRAAQRAAADQAPAPAEPAGGGRRSKRDRRGEGGARREAEVPDELLPKVAVVGRPNVGKSGECGRQAAAVTAGQLTFLYS